MESFSDLEEWDEPEFEYGMKSVDPKNPNGPKEHGVTGIKGHKKHYDLTFTAKNLESLYKMRPASEAGSVTLIIRKIGYDSNPIGHAYQVESYEDLHQNHLMSYGTICLHPGTDWIEVTKTI